MKRFLLASVAVMAMAPAAMAADYDAPPPPYPSLPPQISWDGFHIGGSFGGVFGLPGLADGCQTPDAYDVSPEPVAPLTDAGAANVYEYSPTQIDNAFCRSETSGDSSGFAAGIRGGYDIQMGSWVVGAIGDYNFTDTRQSSLFEFDLDAGVDGSTQEGDYDLPGNLWNIGPITNPPGTELSERGTPLQTLLHETRMEGFGTARARVGRTFGDDGRWLLFASGGLAFGDVSTRWSQMAQYTPDEADRVFDTASGDDSGDGEFFPATETASLPSNCSATAQYEGSGEPGEGQTGVMCSSSGKSSEFQLGYAVGAGAEYMMSDMISIGGEFMYVNLGDVKGPAGDLDFWSAMGTVSLHFK